MSFLLEKGNFHCYVRLPECIGVISPWLPHWFSAIYFGTPRNTPRWRGQNPSTVATFRLIGVTRCWGPHLTQLLWQGCIDLALHRFGPEWKAQTLGNQVFRSFGFTKMWRGFVSAKCFLGGKKSATLFRNDRNPGFDGRTKKGLTPIAWNDPLNQFATDMVESQKSHL